MELQSAARPRHRLNHASVFVHVHLSLTVSANQSIYQPITIGLEFTRLIYIYILSFICTAARKLDKIQIHREMYEYKIKNLLHNISSLYEEHVTENSFESDYTAAE